MINTAEVMLWGTRIGIIHMNEANGVVAFEYDKDFLKSNIEVSPIHMPSGTCKDSISWSTWIGSGFTSR